MSKSSNSTRAGEGSTSKTVSSPKLPKGWSLTDGGYTAKTGIEATENVGYIQRGNFSLGSYTENGKSYIEISDFQSASSKDLQSFARKAAAVSTLDNRLSNLSDQLTLAEVRGNSDRINQLERERERLIQQRNKYLRA